jgi:D-lactate dehydrogenase
MKIALLELHDWEEKYLRGRVDGVHEIVSLPGVLEDNDLAKIADAEIVSPFIYSKLTAERLAKLPKLKMISTRSTGFDHVDMAECARRGITVCNVPFYGENTVAEHTFALILALSRKVHEAFVRVRAGNFSLEGLRGFDLKDKTIGVVGAGRIGLHVIRIARGFGMKVLAFDVKQDNFWAEVLGFEYAELDDLLGRSDIITLHAPYNRHTHHLINRDNVHKIKRGAILINTARGALVNTEALLKALEDGILAGAGLDVLEGEEAIYEESATWRCDEPGEVAHGDPEPCDFEEAECGVHAAQRVQQPRGAGAHSRHDGGEHYGVCGGRAQECRAVGWHSQAADY